MQNLNDGQKAAKVRAALNQMARENEGLAADFTQFAELPSAALAMVYDLLKEEK